MKQKFFSELSKINNSDFDKFISNFLNIKQNIGNGASSGKMFEKLFTILLNKKTNLRALNLNLTNSYFIWDVIIGDSVLIGKENIIRDIVIQSKDSSIAIERINNLIGENWIGVSLKNYVDGALQITTNFKFRTFLDNATNNGIITNVLDNQSTINSFYQLFSEYDTNKFFALGLNYDDTTYTFRDLTFDKKFTKIVFKQNKKLSQYNVHYNDYIFKVLYGGPQANAFQRGVWTYNAKAINYFNVVKVGNYTQNNYFESIISSSII